MNAEKRKGKRKKEQKERKKKKQKRSRLPAREAEKREQETVGRGGRQENRNEVGYVLTAQSLEMIEIDLFEIWR
jgi:hypothetical protein